MKKQLLTLITATASLSFAYAQGPTEKENWADKPVLHTPESKYDKESAVILLDKRRVEYVDEPKDMMSQYYTLHKLVHINDDRGIENFNKIYLGFNENADVVDIKARAILPGGKIIELDKNNIKDLKEQDGNTYKIFAMDGLSKGCEVEYFYTFKRPVNFFGREMMQTGFPIQRSVFQLIRPARLRFDVKAYNGDVATTDTLIDKKRITQCVSENTVGADEEKYAYYEANLKRIEYKLSYNDAKPGERVFTWNEMAKRMQASYSYCTDKELKKVQDLIKNNGWDKIADETKKIMAVESFIKKAYAYNEDLKNDEANMVGTVIQNKIGGMDGMVRLYGAIFKELGVNFQFVLTGDRTKVIVDKTFENWSNCDNALIYFPNEGKFMAPARPDFRYPFINPAWGETNGVFLKGTSIGTFITAIADIKNIGLEDYSRSYNNIESRLELTKGLDSVTIDAKQIFGGYEASVYKSAFSFANDEQKRNITKEMVKQVSSTDHIISSEALNKDLDDDKPFILKSQTRSAEFIERAGNKLLLKIGMAIGQQVEMYQDKPRQQPVNLEFGHVEERQLDFVIPAGYTISNAADLKMEETYKDNGELTMGFVSTYEIKGNILSVRIREEYRKTFYPLSQFDKFRKIINQSSDFNKVVLVLQKT